MRKLTSRNISPQENHAEDREQEKEAEEEMEEEIQQPPFDIGE